MADKARMAAAGRLGAYLLGHSPVDKSLLRRLDLTTEEFAALVAANPGDEALLAALRARGMDEAKIRAWSDRFETTFKTYIPLWDLDEGYTTPSPTQKVVMSLFKTVEAPIMAGVRRLVKRP